MKRLLELVAIAFESLLTEKSKKLKGLPRFTKKQIMEMLTISMAKAVLRHIDEAEADRDLLE